MDTLRLLPDVNNAIDKHCALQAIIAGYRVKTRCNEGAPALFSNASVFSDSSEFSNGDEAGLTPASLA